MTGITCIMSGGAAGNPVLNPLAAGDVADTGGPGTARITFNSNGTITYTGNGGSTGPTSWAGPGFTGFGAGVYVKFTVTGGSLTLNNATTPTQLTANLQFARTSSAASFATVTVDFYSDSGGTNLLCSSPGWQLNLN